MESNLQLAKSGIVVTICTTNFNVKGFNFSHTVRLCFPHGCRDTEQNIYLKTNRLVYVMNMYCKAFHALLYVKQETDLLT
jgi:hypothetical protein